MNNILQTLIGAAMRGADPVKTLEGIVGNDRRMGAVMGLIRGKNPAQLETTARNMARERGLDLDAMIRSMGQMNK